jgi:hypothetical protein
MNKKWKSEKKKVIMRVLSRRLFSSAEAQVRVRYPVTRRALPELERHSQPT